MHPEAGHKKSLLARAAVLGATPKLATKLVGCSTAGPGGVEDVQEVEEDTVSEDERLQDDEGLAEEEDLDAAYDGVSDQQF